MNLAKIRRIIGRKPRWQVGDPVYYRTRKKHRLNTWPIVDHRLFMVETVLVMLEDGSFLLLDVERQLSRRLFVGAFQLQGLLVSDLIEAGLASLIVPSKSLGCVMFTVNEDNPTIPDEWRQTR